MPSGDPSQPPDPSPLLKRPPRPPSNHHSLHQGLHTPPQSFKPSQPRRYSIWIQFHLIRISFHPIRIPFHPIRIPSHTIQFRIRTYHYLFPSATQQPYRTSLPLSHPTLPHPLPEPAQTGLAARGGRHSIRWPPCFSLQHHSFQHHSQHHHSSNLLSLHLLNHHPLSLLSLCWSLGIPLQLPGGRR